MMLCCALDGGDVAVGDLMQVTRVGLNELLDGPSSERDQLARSSRRRSACPMRLPMSQRRVEMARRLDGHLQRLRLGRRGGRSPVMRCA
jgi:hypothetical protein